MKHLSDGNKEVVLFPGEEADSLHGNGQELPIKRTVYRCVGYEVYLNKMVPMLLEIQTLECVPAGDKQAKREAA